MNPDTAAEIEQSDERKQNPPKPRGKCTGCPFDYQLGTARSGEYKGQLVIRKHNSRTGPGLCEGASKPPAIEPGEATGDEQAFADPDPVTEDARGPYFTATYDSMGSCGHEIMSGEEIRADGEGGWLCGLCSDEGARPDRPQHTYDNGNGGVYVHEGTLEACMQDECQEARGHQNGVPGQLPHDAQSSYVKGAEVSSVQEIPNGHDVTGTSGLVFRHGGSLADCTVGTCVQYRNRLNPPPVTTPVTHQCDSGLFADLRNCPVHGVQTPVAVAPGGVPVFDVAPGAQSAAHDFADPVRVPDTGTLTVTPVQQFSDPATPLQELPPVSGQPEPERDRWGRYKILGVSHTRATSFAKLGSSTFALGEWNERMLIAGLVKRPDLLAMAHGLDVKRDKDTLNSIADQAQETAGNKVAANIGTAYHSFTERLDAGLMTLEQVPEQWRGRCKEYVDALSAHGLTTRQEWIERTTAVRADQVSAPVPVAGTLDRIFELPNGELVIGDLKTSSNIDYSWSEIAVQLALYAHGVNTFGLFDWNSKTWQPIARTVGDRAVRTDYAIVVHLPASGEGCTLYRVDLEKGWRFAQVSGMVQARQKAKDVAGVMVPLPRETTAPAPLTSPVVTIQAPRPELVNALAIVDATGLEGLEALYGYAVAANQYDAGELDQIRQACGERWAALSGA